MYTILHNHDSTVQSNLVQALSLDVLLTLNAIAMQAETLANLSKYPNMSNGIS